MADLTANAPIRVWGEEYFDEWVLDNSAAQTVYKGQPIILDISADTVYAHAFVTATVVAADDIFLGIAAEGEIAVATTDAEVDNKVKIWVEPTIVGFKSTVYTDADAGDTVYMSDSGTLSATAADNPMIGKLVRVKDGYCWVRLSSPTICAGA